MNSIEITILRVMHSRRLYGAKHIRIEKIMNSGFPSHLRGDVKKAIESLIKQSYILYAKRSKEAVQLNKALSKEIQELIINKIV